MNRSLTTFHHLLDIHEHTVKRSIKCHYFSIEALKRENIIRKWMTDDIFVMMYRGRRIKLKDHGTISGYKE